MTKNTRNKWQAVCAVVLLSLFTACHSTGNADREAMPDDAMTTAANIRAGWNLGNTLEVGGATIHEAETAWGNPVTTQAMIDSVAAAGFNAVRIPVRWYPHFTEQDGGIEISPEWLGRIKEVVGYCLRRDLYVILNTHHEHWLENHPFYTDSVEVFSRERMLWTAIAQAFRDYDGRLLFAGTNEVHVADDWGVPSQENADVQNGFNQVFIEAVRATGGRNTWRNLIVQTYGTNSDYGPRFFRMPYDPTPDRLMVEVHYYDPYGYCASGEEPYWGVPYSDKGREQEDFLENIFSRLKKQFTDKGFPIILGEYGAGRFTEGADSTKLKEVRTYYYRRVTGTARRNGAVPFIWDNGYTAIGADQFGLFDRHKDMRLTDPHALRGILEGADTPYPFAQKLQ